MKHTMATADIVDALTELKPAPELFCIPSD